VTGRAAALAAAVALSLLFATLVTAAPAQIQTQGQCAPHGPMTAMLATRYLEAPKAIGAVSGNHVMEVYVSAAGSWTLLVTSAQGYACILASGSDWEDVSFQPGARS